MNREWPNMTSKHKIFVTGADGFIGSHLVEQLVSEGHRVRALCQYNSYGFRGWLEDIDPKMANDIDVLKKILIEESRIKDRWTSLHKMPAVEIFVYLTQEIQKDIAIHDDILPGNHMQFLNSFLNHQVLIRQLEEQQDCAPHFQL